MTNLGDPSKVQVYIYLLEVKTRMVICSSASVCLEGARAMHRVLWWWSGIALTPTEISRFLGFSFLVWLLLTMGLYVTCGPGA